PVRATPAMPASATPRLLRLVRTARRLRRILFCRRIDRVERRFLIVRSVNFGFSRRRRERMSAGLHDTVHLRTARTKALPGLVRAFSAVARPRLPADRP